MNVFFRVREFTIFRMQCWRIQVKEQFEGAFTELRWLSQPVIVIATQLHSLLWVPRILTSINLFSFAQMLLLERYALT